MNINEKVSDVKSREDFVVFLDGLRRDLVENSEDWQNQTLGDFLESLSAWVQDMDGYYHNTNQQVPVTPTWKSVAEMMLAAKYYE